MQEKNRPSNKDEMWALVLAVGKDIPQENISKLISNNAPSNANSFRSSWREYSLVVSIILHCNFCEIKK